MKKLARNLWWKGFGDVEMDHLGRWGIVPHPKNECCSFREVVVEISFGNGFPFCTLSSEANMVICQRVGIQCSGKTIRGSS